jgi:hypothetical protein
MLFCSVVVAIFLIATDIARFQNVSLINTYVESAYRVEKSGRITHVAHVMSLLHKPLHQPTSFVNLAPSFSSPHTAAPNNTLSIFAELLYIVFCFTAFAVILSLGCCMSLDEIIIPDYNKEIEVQLRMLRGFSGYINIFSIYKHNLYPLPAPLSRTYCTSSSPSNCAYYSKLMYLFETHMELPSCIA